MDPNQLFAVVKESVLVNLNSDDVNDTTNELLGFLPNRGKTKRSLEKTFDDPEIQAAIVQLADIIAEAAVSRYYD